MKLSELRRIISEEVRIVLSENNNVDYQYLVNLIKGANNPQKLKISYDSANNVVSVGGTGYDKGGLVNTFKQQPGTSDTIRAAFYNANKDPQTTKREIERLSGGKIKVDLGKGYGNEIIVYYTSQY
jgi:hypothetical protein